MNLRIKNAPKKYVLIGNGTMSAWNTEKEARQHANKLAASSLQPYFLYEGKEVFTPECVVLTAKFDEEAPNADEQEQTQERP